jgi:hypothetical protein
LQAKQEADVLGDGKAVRAFGVVALVMAILGLCVGGALAKPQHHGHQRVKIAGSVSGSTLTVKLQGKGGSKCSLWLGSGKDRQHLPGLYLGARGRGQLDWDIPSDTPTGDNRLKVMCGYSGVRSTNHTIVDIPESAVSGTFTTVLNALLYVVLAGGLVIFFLNLLGLVIGAPQSERFPRATAMMGGGIVALLAEVSGTGFADQIVEALAGSSPAGEGVKLLAIVIPGGAAVAFGWYFSYYSLQHSTYKAIRWVVLLGMLTLVTFVVILAEATKAKGVFLGEAAIPNASFVLGFILSFIAFSEAEDESDQGGLLRGILGRFRPKPRNPFAED